MFGPVAMSGDLGNSHCEDYGSGTFLVLGLLLLRREDEAVSRYLDTDDGIQPSATEGSHLHQPEHGRWRWSPSSLLTSSSVKALSGSPWRALGGAFRSPQGSLGAYSLFTIHCQ